jgi:hypothetical protein
MKIRKILTKVVFVCAVLESIITLILVVAKFIYPTQDIQILIPLISCFCLYIGFGALQYNINCTEKKKNKK